MSLITRTVRGLTAKALRHTKAFDDTVYLYDNDDDADAYAADLERGTNRISQATQCFLTKFIGYATTLPSKTDESSRSHAHADQNDPGGEGESTSAHRATWIHVDGMFS